MLNLETKWLGAIYEYVILKCTYWYWNYKILLHWIFTIQTFLRELMLTVSHAYIIPKSFGAHSIIPFDVIWYYNPQKNKNRMENIQRELLILNSVHLWADVSCSVYWNIFAWPANLHCGKGNIKNLKVLASHIQYIIFNLTNDEKELPHSVWYCLKNAVIWNKTCHQIQHPKDINVTMNVLLITKKFG